MDQSYEDEKKEFHNISNIMNLEKLSADDKKQLKERLFNMINYAISRHDYYDEQKNKILQIAIAVLGASAALSAVVVSINSKISLLPEILAWLFIVVLFITGLIIVFIFVSSMGKNYPHRKVADIRSWWFAYNFSSQITENISSNKEKAKKEVNEIITAFHSYIKRWNEYLTDDKFIHEDLEQVFILQILQRAKHQQVKRMGNTLKYGLLLAGVLLFSSVISSKYQPLHTPTNPISITFQDSLNINKNINLSNGKLIYNTTIQFDTLVNNNLINNDTSRAIKHSAVKKN